MANFIPGLSLAEQFYRTAVRPILDGAFPGLAYSAALIGSGSEVLGFDTPVSTDHDWGPRVMLFLREAEHARVAAALGATLRERLPHRFREWPTNFAPPDPVDNGTHLLQATTFGPVNHRVEVLTPRGFILAHLGFDLHDPLEPADWLTFASQKLRALTAGAIFHDGIGLKAVQERFAWYPHDVWLYLLAAGWKRISQEEHLMGRAGQVGDELGSMLIAGRLVRDLMRLCFLMERQYAPYPKWYGTAFAHLKAAPALQPLLWQALRAERWPEREQALGQAYAQVAQQHNALGLTDSLPTRTQPFFDRPFAVIFGGRFTEALKGCIRDARVQRIPLDLGGIDHWSDSTDLLGAAELRLRVRQLYLPRDAAIITESPTPG